MSEEAKQHRSPNGFAVAGAVVGVFSVFLPPLQYGTLENFIIGLMGVLAIVLSCVGIEYVVSTRTRTPAVFWIFVGIVAGIIGIHRMSAIL
jgi:hypothetical protein